MSLTTPLSVQKLQTALHDKAKGSPKFRFYALYDKVYREDVMAFAYECCKANRGAAGVDGQTYQPQPVRRVYIPKPDGETKAVRSADGRRSPPAKSGRADLGGGVRGRFPGVLVWISARM